jgi:hypothetical protein
MTYEAPELNTIGNAGEVILGIITNGDDLDQYMVILDFEFASDSD